MKATLAWTLSISSFLFAFGAWGQCLNPELNPPGPVSPTDDVSIEFDAVEGATRYRVEGYDPVEGGWFLLGTTLQSPFELPPFRFASDQELRIRIFPEADGGGQICVEEIRVQFVGDFTLRREFGRVVIPVAGSLAGAHGSQWRTMLSITNSRTRETLTGTIIFHPAGAIASDQDPSLEYSLEPGEVLQWPDIAGTLGATGLGTIDIIPDDHVPGANQHIGGYVPAIQARVVNDADDATYGTNVREVFVRDLAPPQVREFLNNTFPSPPEGRGLGTSIIVPPDYGQTRLNIGFRYFDFEHLFWIQPLDPQGTPFVQLALRRDGEFIEDVIRERPAGYMEQVPVEEIFTTALLPGDVIVVRSVSALVYWTITDNTTNDPSFFFDTYPGQSKRIVYE